MSKLHKDTPECYARHLVAGPGLKIPEDSGADWWGGCYCGLCGCRNEADDDGFGDPVLIPRPVRWWDCDDGWKYSILCRYCLDDVRPRGPEPGDYAVETRDIEEQEDRIDIGHDFGCQDSTYSDNRDSS